MHTLAHLTYSKCGYRVLLLPGRCTDGNASLVCGQVRAFLKQRKAGKYGKRVAAQQRRREHKAAHPMPRDALADVFKN